MGWFDSFDFFDPGMVESAADLGSSAASAAPSPEAFTPAISGALDAFGSTDIGSANPATFGGNNGPPTAEQQAPTTSTPQDPTSTSGAVGQMGIPGATAPQPPPGGPQTEANRQPGSWWSNFAHNTAKGVTDIPGKVAADPWGTVGKAALPIGLMGLNAAMAPNTQAPKPYTFPQYPNADPRTNNPNDPTLPAPGNPVSPILRGGMNVRQSTGLNR